MFRIALADAMEAVNRYPGMRCQFTKVFRHRRRPCSWLVRSVRFDSNSPACARSPGFRAFTQPSRGNRPVGSRPAVGVRSAESSRRSPNPVSGEFGEEVAKDRYGLAHGPARFHRLGGELPRHRTLRAVPRPFPWAPATSSTSSSQVR